MTIQYIRDTYNVPVKQGMRVITQDNEPGRVTSCSCYVHVRTLSASRPRPYHPHELTYLDDKGKILWEPSND